MNRTYVILSKTLRSFIFYVGSTSKSPLARYQQHLKGRLKNTKSMLIPEISELVGDMSPASARTAEAFIARSIRSIGLEAETDLELDGLSRSKEIVQIVTNESCIEAWRKSKFSLTSSGLAHRSEEMTTLGINELRHKLLQISSAFGKTIPNGRFALNEKKQLIRYLSPPAGINLQTVFVVAKDINGDVVTYDHNIYFPSGEIFVPNGPEISSTDFLEELPTVPLQYFEELEPTILAILRSAIKKWQG